jgi:DNA-binding transcriptional ArsR family regulator
MIPALDAILGNRTAASVLLFLENYGAGYAREIARTFGVSVSVVQDQLLKLEGAGVLISRRVGRTRVFDFNPRNPTAGRLRAFLSAELDALPDSILDSYFRDRRRPRRTGKPLERIDG